jgi:hypothetical protein
VVETREGQVEKNPSWESRFASGSQAVFASAAPLSKLGARKPRARKPKCDGCGKPAVLRVNGHPVCSSCVDLPSEDGEESKVEAL